MPSSSRSAFTLIELLVVIAILAALGGMLVPVVTNSIRTANETESFNNMRQISQGVTDWRAEIGKPTSELFPAHLAILFNPQAGGPFEPNLQDKLLISPGDGTDGSSWNMGRPDGWGIDWDDKRSPHNPHLNNYTVSNKSCSYLYECSSRDAPSSWWDSVDPPNGGGPADGTWADYKRAQKRYYKPIQGGVSADSLPLIRDFYFGDWDGDSSDQTKVEVLNVSWTGRAFKSTPPWEHSELGVPLSEL